VQLYEARQSIRPSKEQEAENRAQEVYSEKYSPLLMFDIKKAVSRMLDEDAERLAVRKLVRQAQKEQNILNKRKDKGGCEKNEKSFFHSPLFMRKHMKFSKNTYNSPYPISLMMKWLMRLSQSSSFYCEIY